MAGLPINRTSIWPILGAFHFLTISLGHSCPVISHLALLALSSILVLLFFLSSFLLSFPFFFAWTFMYSSRTARFQAMVRAVLFNHIVFTMHPPCCLIRQAVQQYFPSWRLLCDVFHVWCAGIVWRSNRGSARCCRPFQDSSAIALAKARDSWPSVPI